MLLFVGRFAPHKRQDVLIRVLAALRAGHSTEAKLMLVGSGDLPTYIQALRDFANQLGVTEAVRIHDRGVSDAELGDLYAQASVYVSASDHEGFCLPLLEAMAFSLPVLAYDAGAVAETVGGGGVVVPDRDPLVWAELAWRLATDPQLREQCSAAGLKRLEDFSDEAVGAQLDSALNTIGVRPPKR